MLSIGKLGAAQASYYTEQLTHSVGEDRPVLTGASTSAQVDYYAAHESPSRWMGSSLGKLGLTQGAPVGKATFTNLMNHQTPDGESMTVARANRLKVAAFDYTLSAPKSVSLMFAFGDDHIRTAVIEAHHHAVTAALEYMETEASQTRMVTRYRDDEGRHRTKTRTVETDGYIAAAFDHYTSRANDPQVHTHVVVINRVFAEGGWRAIDAKRSYAHAKAGGTIYQAVLRKALTERLGVNWKPVVNGMADIDGITDELIHHFSTRRSEIVDAVERYLAQHGGNPHRRVWQTFTLETRQAKTHPKGNIKTTTKMRDYGIDGSIEDHWQRRAADAPHDVVSAVHQVVRSPRQIDQPATEQLAAAADTIATAVTDTQPVFTRRDLTAFVAAHYPRGTTAGQLHQAVDTVIDALENTGKLRTILPTSHLDLTLPAGTRLTDEELDLLTGDDSQGWIQHTSHLRFRALPGEPRYTTQTQLDNEQAIIDATHQQHHHRIEPKLLEDAIAARNLDTEQAQAIRSLAATSGRVVAVTGPGGSGKTYSVGAYADAITGRTIIGVATSAAAALNLGHDLPDRWTGTIAMLKADVGHRNQQLPAGTVIIADEASMISTNDLTWLTTQVQQCDGQLVLIGDPKQLPSVTAGGMFHRIVAAGHNVIADLEDTNHRQQLDLDRDLLRRMRAGQIRAAIVDYHTEDRLHLGRDEYHTKTDMVDTWWTDVEAHSLEGVRMLASRHDEVWMLNELARTHMQASDRLTGPILCNRWGVEFQTGDRIVVRENWYANGDLRNGQTGTITNVDPARRSLTMRRDIDGAMIQISGRYLDSGVQHAYAQTIHTAQGQTFQAAHVYIDATMQSEHGYTALSRARQETHVWINHQDGPLGNCTHTHGTPLAQDPIETVIRQLQTTVIEPTATDHGLAVQTATDQQLTEWKNQLTAQILASPLMNDVEEQLTATDAALAEAHRLQAETPRLGIERHIEQLANEKERLEVLATERSAWLETSHATLSTFSAITAEQSWRSVARTTTSRLGAPTAGARTHWPALSLQDV